MHNGLLLLQRRLCDTFAIVEMDLSLPFCKGTGPDCALLKIRANLMMYKNVIIP